MTKLIAKEKIINTAKKEGVDFGSGDPYNRLRYYTKLGWIPHMVRQQNNKKEVVGHYPDWVIERLKYIQELKDRNLSNDEITQKIKNLDVKRNIIKSFDILKSPQKRLQLISYISFLVLLFILSAEIGLIPLGQGKQKLIENTKTVQNIPNQILDSGKALLPMNERVVFIESDSITATSKINVTFEDDISPAKNFWITKKIPNEGFYLELDGPSGANANFSWWVSE